MKCRRLFFVLLACCFVSCATPTDRQEDTVPQPEPVWEGEALTVTEFGEVWAYLLDGREQTLPPAAPLTDVGY
jgi:hypothetical protein